MIDRTVSNTLGEEFIQIFRAGLHLEDQWIIVNVEFIPSGVAKKIKGVSQSDRNREAERPELHIYLVYAKGSTFECPVDGCSEQCKAYDTVERVWRHLNFFEFKCYIHASVPRVECPVHGVKTIQVPWAVPNSGFTLYFEAMAVELSHFVNPSQLGIVVKEHDTTLWRMLKRVVNKALNLRSLEEVHAVGFDETSLRGQNYITVVANLDPDNRNVLYVTDGKDKGVVDKFKDFLSEHGGDPQKVDITTSDMAIGFVNHVHEVFPNSCQIIDKFHLVSRINDAVDEIRREEAKHNAVLKHTRYLWLKNDRNLSAKQLEQRGGLMKLHLKTARAFSMRVELQDILDNSTTRAEAEDGLKALCSWMMHSRLDEMKKVAKTFRTYWDQILNYFDHRYTNATLEGLNSIIQNIKRCSRGFRNPEYFKTMIYLVCGGLPLDRVVVRL